MEITGKLIKILEPQRGESQRGPWVRGGFVIETDGEYPRQVAFTTFGEDRLQMINVLQLNTPVVVNFTPESREFNDRWYTDLRCSRVQAYIPGQMPPATMGYNYPQQPVAAPMQPTAQSMAAPAQPAGGFAQAPAASTQPGATTMPNQDEDLPF